MGILNFFFNLAFTVFSFQIAGKIKLDFFKVTKIAIFSKKITKII